MSVNNGGHALAQLRTLLSVGAIGALSDAELLEQFATGGDDSREWAFTALVERHGPLVLRVCSSVLRDREAAEDAFQATFLALALKARSLRVRHSLAPWLHQTAYRAAAHDRSASVRRRSHERAAALLRPESLPPSQDSDGDAELEKMIHEEINRLPGRFRVAVVLCDLEGRTHEQAAHHLGCAIGTVKSRLARGRDKLRGRLVRRGLAPATALAAVSAAGASRAAVPLALGRSTVVFAATASTAPLSVTVLVEGVLMSMFLSKAKVVMLVASVVAAVTGGAAILAQSGAGAAQSETTTQPQQVAPVTLTSPKVTDVTLTLQYVGRIHTQHINIYAVERGYLQEIKVREGQRVKKGDAMFKIAPLLTTVKLGLASTTVITAPTDGIVDLPRQQPGSLVNAGEILTTLSDNSKVWVYFNVPEVQYLEYMAHPQEYFDNDKIELILANDTQFPHPGKLGAIEASFNKNGSIAYRADFPNPDGLLRQGQSGTVLFRRKLRNALVIPQRATFEKLAKRYVYVVDGKDIAHLRQIEIQRELDDIYVIRKGLSVDERIVLEGVKRVRDGAKVE